MTPELRELAFLGLEKAFNAALSADPEAQANVAALQGKRLRIELKGLFSFDILPQSKTIIIADSGIDTPDATLRASALGFIRAKMRGDLMHGDLELLGDSHVSLRAARLLSGLNPDLERALAPKIGGLLAHQIGRVWQSARAEIARALQHHTLNKADYLHDEINVAPRQAELEAWMDAIDPLQNRIAALDTRLSALEAAQAGKQP
ncbi:MAG: SCP2 domain-containing protein [Halothiobacillaceae bacterium]